MIKYTEGSWLRTYPIATEVYSANYDPAPMFKVGAQIIALNTQTKDDYAWMTFAYFCGGNATNASQRGFVLKPLRLREPSSVEKIERRKHVLTIRVVESCGYNISMKFHGLQEDNVLNNLPNNNFTYYNPEESFIIFDFD